MPDNNNKNNNNNNNISSMQLRLTKTFRSLLICCGSRIPNYSLKRETYDIYSVLLVKNFLKFLKWNRFSLVGLCGSIDRIKNEVDLRACIQSILKTKHWLLRKPPF